MLNRIIIAVVLGVVAGLVCLAVGTLLEALHVPPATVVGGFLTAWAWVIAVLVGLYVFATGRTAL